MLEHAERQMDYLWSFFEQSLVEVISHIYQMFG